MNKPKRKYTMSEEERERRRERVRQLQSEGKLRRKHPMSEEEKKLHRGLLQSPEVKAKRLQSQQRPEYLEKQSERARQSYADGAFRRKTPITNEEREAASQRMKANNPVNSPEVREKIAATLRKQSKQLAARLDQMRRDGLITHPPMSEANKAAASARMKANNPMKRPEVAAKVSISKLWRHFGNPKVIAEAWIRAGVAPNKAEQALAELIASLGFRFVGDALFWIGPCRSGRCRNPDFIYKSGRNRIAILLHGEYWHRAESDAVELADYTGKGWQVLTIWTKELSDPIAVFAKTKTWLAGLKSSV